MCGVSSTGQPHTDWRGPRSGSCSHSQPQHRTPTRPGAPVTSTRGFNNTEDCVSNYVPSSNINSTLGTHHRHHPSQSWGAAQGQKSRWSFSGRVSRDSHLWSTFKFCLIDWGWCFSERGISKIWRWCWSSISVIVNKSLPYKFPRTNNSKLRYLELYLNTSKIKMSGLVWCWPDWMLMLQC